MKVKVHSIHFDADEKLLAFIDKKVGKLENYFDQIITSEVYLRLDNSSNAINKVAEIRMNIPGKELFAKKQCKSFEEAADTAIDALKRQLKRYKDKHSKD